MKHKIAIIGTGHIGRALYDGLLNSKMVLPSDFILTNHQSENKKAVKQSDIIILCVRPRVIKSVIDEVSREIDTTKLIISVAACVPVSLLQNYFKRTDLQIIRIIPNIPVAYGKGVVGWLSNGKVGKEELNRFSKLFSALGFLIHCKNDEGLEKMGLIAGCGIGYVAYFMNNLEKAARKFGFSKLDAQKIVHQVFSGTACHIQKSGLTSDEIISAVATKGGLTEEVLNSLDEGNFQNLLFKSIEKGYIKERLISKIVNEEL